jgi:signal transduction histidine kinase
MNGSRRRWWSYGRVLIVPLLLWGLVVVSLWAPVEEWLKGSKQADEAILQEWLDDVSGLPDMVKKYIQKLDHLSDLTERLATAEKKGNDEKELAQLRAEKTTTSEEVIDFRQKIRETLSALGEPSKRDNETQPLLTRIYRIRIGFEDDLAPPIEWNSHLPGQRNDVEEMTHALGPRAQVVVRYQMHVFDKRQQEEMNRPARVRRLGLLAIVATALAIAWMIYVQRREYEQQRQQQLAQQQVDLAERLLLQEELRRQEAEHRQQEAEHDLLQQKLAAQEYEQKMLEMKSQLYASIGIMAGSYAHNIKNLLVRPNDLLRRCLEIDGVSSEQARMLNEVRQTLGTVTERLQQILQTVRRDPSRSEMARLDLRVLLRNLEQTWRDLAWERWKIQLSVEVDEKPLWVDGDLSHLQQAIENLLFNARDATFEMRLHLREEARQKEQNESGRRQALIAAASWKGSVVVRAWREQGEVVVEVSDNGIGMSEEVRKRCTETHFSTKRDNASYEGNSTGMGLGLSFVKVVLDNHGAKLEIDSQPLEGATFRIRFPARHQQETPSIPAASGST